MHNHEEALGFSVKRGDKDIFDLLLPHQSQNTILFVLMTMGDDKPNHYDIFEMLYSSVPLKDIQDFLLEPDFQLEPDHKYRIERRIKADLDALALKSSMKTVMERKSIGPDADTFNQKHQKKI